MKEDPIKKVPWSRVTRKDGLIWLRSNDPEGIDHYPDSLNKTQVIGLVTDNLRDFGFDSQSGIIQITTTNQIKEDLNHRKYRGR